MRCPIHVVAIGCGIFIAVGFLTLSGAAAEEPLRTWSDESGDYEIEARFVKVEGELAILLDKEGNEIEIPIAKLRAADREYIEKKSKKPAVNPFKKKEKKSKKPSDAKEQSTPSQENDDAAKSANRKKRPTRKKRDLASLKPITLTPPGGAWRLNPPPPEDLDLAGAPSLLPLPAKLDFFDKIRGLVVDARAKIAVAGFRVNFGQQGNRSRIIFCNLATGETTESETTSTALFPIALHPDGKRVLMLSEEGPSNRDRVELWSLDGRQIVSEWKWSPYENDPGTARTVKWAEFLNENRLATMNDSGKLVVWNFPELEPVYVMQLSGAGRPALSSDRRLLAYCTGVDVVVIDLDQREIVAQQPTGQPMAFSQLAFSPSGRKLACGAHQNVMVWDVATGAVELQMPYLFGTNEETPVVFCDENYLLVGGSVLVDLENRVRLWTYSGHEILRSVGGWSLIGVANGDKSPSALLLAQLPHEEARTLLERAKADPGLLVLQPGVAVSLNLNGIDRAQWGWMEQSLRKRLEALGCQVVTEGTIELVASLEGPTMRRVSFSPFFGNPFNGEERDVTEWISRLQFRFQGAVAWEASASNIPGTIQLKENETLDAALARHASPNFNFFNDAELPPMLQRPRDGRPAGEGLTIGATKFSTSGIP